MNCSSEHERLNGFFRTWIQHFSKKWSKRVCFSTQSLCRSMSSVGSPEEHLAHRRSVSWILQTCDKILGNGRGLSERAALTPCRLRRWTYAIATLWAAGCPALRLEKVLKLAPVNHFSRRKCSIFGCGTSALSGRCLLTFHGFQSDESVWKSNTALTPCPPNYGGLDVTHFGWRKRKLFPRWPAVLRRGFRRLQSI